MIFDDKISVLIPVPQALGTGEHQRQEHFRVLSPPHVSVLFKIQVTDTSIRLLQAFNPGIEFN